MKLHLSQWDNLAPQLNLYKNPHIMEANHVNLTGVRISDRVEYFLLDIL